ncbi:MAG TPA: sugar ABC transporter permease [Limnochordia bacterium]|mgnify:CR=1 FL=1|jgi:arabinogalactan oligomer/maltooligosaccharide transport system permease protein|nr:sugar ABC transporter permease [Bacillota bacterium]HOB09900.1 sugar ABC transporter permease [Limnochordia bacterium]HPZ31850.1 sugar ABC transporter permease [Limnochordia bacterium]
MGTAVTIQPPKRRDPVRSKLLLSSLLFMGLGHIIYLKQYVKGLFFAAVEITFLAFLPKIFVALENLITLGEPAPHLPIRERPHSMFMLIDGVVVLVLVFVFIGVYIISVRSALAEYDQERTARIGLKEAINRAFPIFGLAPSVGLILLFVVVPLIFSACVAFTNYSSPGHIPPNNTVDWVGLENFKTLFGGHATWTGALGRVFLWSLAWAVLATATCYFGGLIMAVVIKESRIKIAGFFRVLFILPYAIPSVISMLVWQNLLNGTFGTLNRTLFALNVISKPIPWLGDPWLAKFTAVMINLWAGFPYFMLLALGSMTAVSQDIYEAAEIDGAGKFQLFRKIILPIVLYQTAPLIIMSFTHNFNNFGAIFFLTGGGPVVRDTTLTTAGGTDILITWIYKLTVNLMKYHYASVLSVMIFLILAPIAILNLRRTRSFREGAL